MRWKGLLLCGMAAALFAGTAVAEDDALRRAAQLIQNGSYDEAVTLVNGYLANNPGDARALATLANAYHSKGDYKAAIAANRQAAATRWAAPTALYNEACALSLLGHADQAYAALQQAMEVGFLDYDLIATDTDLANLRAKHEVAFPDEQKYESFKARNGVKLGYRVVTPQGYDSHKFYPALVVFAPGNGTRTADWAAEQLIGSGDSRDWIVVYPIAPDRGWFTHPSHHALNDMLDEVREAHKIENNKYYLAGFGSGARVASTYSKMSREYFLTLTTFSAWHWDRWDDDDLASGFGMPVRLVVGKQDEFGLKMNMRAHELMAGKGNVELKIVVSDDHMLASVRHGRLIEYVPREHPVVSRPE